MTSSDYRLEKIEGFDHKTKLAHVEYIAFMVLYTGIKSQVREGHVYNAKSNHSFLLTTPIFNSLHLCI